MSGEDLQLLASPVEGIPSFGATYQEVVSEVVSFLTPKMQAELARHNAGWRADCTDFEGYLRASEIRYHIALSALGGRSIPSLCDIGGFWGALPVTALRLGVERVAMTEALKYYSTSFDRLFSFISDQGVEVIDFDPFEERPLAKGEFDAVSVMAVLEHYPHSPEMVMRQLVSLLRDSRSRIHIEVPNIAYMPKRLALLRGRTPLVPIQTVWASMVPFTGHHHEYTLDELKTICSSAGLDVQRLWAYNYSSLPRRGLSALTGAIRHPLTEGAYLLDPTAREVLAVTCGSADHPIEEEAVGCGDAR